ncbi:hypothetical protein SPRG_11848 [Saprolegnia parasitica CBS 223.65]|uniref:Uncharacterized protein n=1 Tax=Saprolegnia parasitica (strain CBS 223.65) TaxID=695850 RepID=A0A067C854_SAPPC|nr:hypothetical protein SPRG_11848 [Saprolegnia parasitica CBS 223.65]KDO23002.1 hypothetical protein SPRG_11848 [Saprolegnia parasitica CBS 223.65]|eukprot:XP_012206290.1 hypothetical protein SPRG_11848 [Saprolegnia parasitica CBS 223.65]
MSLETLSDTPDALENRLYTEMDLLSTHVLACLGDNELDELVLQRTNYHVLEQVQTTLLFA